MSFRPATVCVCMIGLAHLLYPRAFEPLNRRLGFTTNTRRRVYIHGVIETALGLSAAYRNLRGPATVAGALYLAYLLSNPLRTRQRDGQAYRTP